MKIERDHGKELKQLRVVPCVLSDLKQMLVHSSARMKVWFIVDLLLDDLRSFLWVGQ